MAVPSPLSRRPPRAAARLIGCRGVGTLPASRLLAALASAALSAGCERIEGGRDLLSPYPSGVEGPGSPAAAAPESAPALPPAVPAPEPRSAVLVPAPGTSPVRTVTPLAPDDPALTAPAAASAQPDGPSALDGRDRRGEPDGAPPDVGSGTSAQPQARSAGGAIGGERGPRWASSVPARAALAAWPLHQVALVATVPSGPSPLAVVRTPDGDEHVVRVGTVVGDTGSRVTWIGPDQIALAEVELDPSGRPTLAQRTLARTVAVR